ncbi:MAG: DUF1998 domain-containing protein [Myxococcales bacterium]|nr:DUF1998 domain-containing protein [Myxococcales bacterium]
MARQGKYKPAKDKDLALERPGALRASQLVTTYGPGAMLDLVHDAVLVRGLRGWRYQNLADAKIAAPELRKRLEPELAKVYPDGRLKLMSPAFRRPPAGDDDDPTQRQGVHVSTFPNWFVCQQCHALVERRDLDEKQHHGRPVHRHANCGTAKPVRFVTSCKRGHLSDFPWDFFVHQGEPCGGKRFKLREGASGDLSEVRVKCVQCKRSRDLAKAKSPQALGTCTGYMPWISFKKNANGCEEERRLLVRTASNAYFAQVVSALRMDEPERPPIFDLLEQHAGSLSKVTGVGQVALVRDFNEDFARDAAAYSDAQIWAGLEALRERDEETSTKPLRRVEWERFLEAEPEPAPGVRPDRTREFVVQRALDVELPPQIEQVILAHKLLEIRAQIGFTRFEAQDPDLDGEFTLDVKTAPMAETLEWIPAVDVRGEGFLLVFDEERLHAWETSQAVREREKELEGGFMAEKARNPRLHDLKFPGARFYLLHSLAHMLITAVSLESGYSASAIRERIYCSMPGTHRSARIAGILLSTGTTGSEGTLGGLVDRGRRVLEHLRLAWDQGTLCSNDPVCAQHLPDGDHAERYLEGAACHGCLFIAECSCERFNRYLDRALVVPTLGMPRALAFFPERP